jgi:two-component system, LytTR family, sensor kinase
VYKMQHTEHRMPIRVLTIIFWCLVTLWIHHGNLMAYQNNALPFTIGLVVCNLMCAWLVVEVLTPNFFDKRRYLLFCLACLGLVLMASLLYLTVQYLFVFTKQHKISFYALRLLTCTIDNFIVLTVFTSYYLIYHVFSSQNITLRKEKELINYELQNLRQQMSPHFIFNAINSIYISMDVQPKLAKENLMQFSELLRHQLYESQNEYIALDKELDFLDKYIAIEKLRKEDTLWIETNIEHTNSKAQIPPMLLQPFIENAFKYVSSRLPDNYIKITLSTSSTTLRFNIKNSMEVQLPERPKAIGIKTVSRRLQLIYPKNHQLNIDSNIDHNYYEVTLQIPLQ